MKGGSGGTTQNLSTVKFFPKLINVQLHHLINVLSYFLLFGVGITLGMILTFYLKDFSFSLQLAQFSFSTSSSSSNRNMILPNVTAAQTNLSQPHHIGLEKFLKPPKILHDMNDEELLWRASMAPRRSDYPFHRVPKVAFLFLTKGPVFLAPLWEKFFKGHQGLYSIYVHSNPSYNGSYPESPVFQGRRIPSQEVVWGNVNMIEAERRLLANALLDISNDHFVLLSESCIPLHNFRTIYYFLVKSKQTFVEVYDDPSSVGRGRYSSHMYPQISLSLWRKGSQWFQIDRDIATEVVADKKFFPLFQKYCRGSCYADEHYFPTFVHMKFSAKNSNKTLTWYDFSRGGPHPAQFTRTDVTVDLLNSFRNGTKCLDYLMTGKVCPRLFARKFTPGTLERLLRFAPKLMQFNR
ncbi:glycosyltransferase BC10 [Rosa sericea]